MVILFAAILASFGTVTAAYVVIQDVKDVFPCPETFEVIFAVAQLFLIAVSVFLTSVLWIFAAAAWVEPQMQDPTLIQAIEVLLAAGNQ